MSTSSTIIGDRRRAAYERAAAERDNAMRRHPTRTAVARPNTPPTLPYYLIAVVVFMFTMLGLVMVMSATSISQFHSGHSPWRLFSRQATWAVVGAGGLYTVTRLQLHRWRKIVPWLYLVGLGLMLLPFVPGLGDRVNEASSWVAVGQFTFQPSEFLKLGLLLACANLLAERKDEMHLPKRTFFPLVGLAGAAAFLCLAQGDLGSTIVLVAIVFAMAFIAGAPMPLMVASTAVSGVGAYLFAMSNERRAARFTAFLDIAAHKDHLSYQTYQAMIAVAQGGLTGSGVGRGDNKLGEFLPLAHSDFIFAVVAEELGMIGVVAVLGGFLVLAFAGIQVALATHDRFHSLLASGIVAWLVVQTIINVGGVVGMLPVTGLTLPFFSAGGSSLFVTLVASGILLNISRNVR